MPRARSERGDVRNPAADHTAQLSPEDVIREIVNREGEDRGLDEAVVKNDAPDIWMWACKHFGTWWTALQYAGVQSRHQQPIQRHRREEVIEWIQRQIRSGVLLNSTTARGSNRPMHRSAIHHFGSWSASLEAAGVVLPNFAASRREVVKQTPEALLAGLRQWHEEGRSIAWPDMALANNRLAMGLRRRFGSWNQALAAAGLVSTERLPSYPRKWSRQKIIEAIQERGRQGLPVSYAAVRRDEHALTSAGQRYFGSWGAALKAAGISLPRKRRRE